MGTPNFGETPCTVVSMQARRMDPSQYTTHVDGLAAEFMGRPGARFRVLDLGFWFGIA